ncbi:MAG: hypothetical protein J6W03_05705 [Bacteroidaceae bacterium]|nr:hypothetical protein [Bacteroidaceae bacterium]
MKRITTFMTALLATATVAYAQSFEFQYRGQSLEDEATVAFEAEMNFFDELVCETNPASNPDDGLVLKLLDASSADVSATLTTSGNDFDAQLIQWCMGGNCSLVRPWNSLNKTFTMGSSEQVQFDASNILGEGTFEATLSVTIGGVEKSVNILFTNPGSQLWASLYDSDGNWIIYGTGKEERYSTATYIPYGYLGGEGATVEGFAFYFLTPNVADISVWVSSELPAFGTPADMETVEFPMEEFEEENFCEVTFATPHVVPEGGLYVGYSFTVTYANDFYGSYPVCYMSTSSPRPKGCITCSASSPSWYESNGELMVRVLAGGGQFKSNAVKVDAEELVYTVKGSEQAVDVTIQNVGSTPARSLKYVLETDGEVVSSGTLMSDIDEMLSRQTFSIPIPTDGEAEITERTFRVTEVNSQPNGADDGAASISQYNMLSKPQFVPLFEEFTGTWCQYCVRGIVAMNRASEQYGDKAVLIAVHDDTPMGVDAYMPVVERYCNGYPSGIYNRSVSTSIGVTTVVNAVQSTLDNITPAQIEAVAQWSNQEKTSITVDTKTTFQLNIPDGNYAIAYVLLADGLTGTGSSWNQSNFYSGQTAAEPELQWWCNQPSSVPGVVYDHVAVAAWDVLYGVSGSVSNAIVAGQAQNYRFQADVSDNTIIQDKTKLKMACLLLDAQTGAFINAAQTSISDFSDGITSITSDASGEPEALYSVDGRKLPAAQKGINIVRMADGTARKVLVK